MATMLCLELSEDATPLDRLAHTVRDMADRLGMLVRTSQGNPPIPAHETYVLTTGLLVDVSRPFVGADPSQDPFLVDFGMTRGPTVDFTYDSSHEGFEHQDDQIMAIVFGLLGTFSGDAVLHYEYFLIHLARFKGQLFLSD